MAHDHGLQVNVDNLGTSIVGHVVAGSRQSRQESDFRSRHDAVDDLEEFQRQLRARVGADSTIHITQASAVQRVRADGIIESNHEDPISAKAGQLSVRMVVCWRRRGSRETAVGDHPETPMYLIL